MFRVLQKSKGIWKKQKSSRAVVKWTRSGKIEEDYEVADAISIELCRNYNSSLNTALSYPVVKMEACFPVGKDELRNKFAVKLMNLIDNFLTEEGGL